MQIWTAFCCSFFDPAVFGPNLDGPAWCETIFQFEKDNTCNHKIDYVANVLNTVEETKPVTWISCVNEIPKQIESNRENPRSGFWYLDISNLCVLLIPVQRVVFQQSRKATPGCNNSKESWSWQPTQWKPQIQANRHHQKVSQIFSSSRHYIGSFSAMQFIFKWQGKASSLWEYQHLSKRHRYNAPILWRCAAGIQNVYLKKRKRTSPTEYICWQKLNFIPRAKRHKNVFLTLCHWIHSIHKPTFLLKCQDRIFPLNWPVFRPKYFPGNKLGNPASAFVWAPKGPKIFSEASESAFYCVTGDGIEANHLGAAPVKGNLRRSMILAISSYCFESTSTIGIDPPWIKEIAHGNGTQYLLLGLPPYDPINNWEPFDSKPRKAESMKTPALL